MLGSTLLRDGVALALFAAAVTTCWYGGYSAQDIVAEIAILALLAMSLDFIVGFAGLVSLGHALFYGLSAYTVGGLTVHLQFPPSVAIVGGVAVAALAAAATGALVVRLTVRENLLLAARENRNSPSDKWDLDRVFSLFPRLQERLNNGGQLSGGEQQMLSISRALLTNPELLLLDEPTEGLAPVVVHQLRDALARVKQTGLTIVLVEQNLPVALSLADEIIVLGKGLLRWKGASIEFQHATDIRNTWLSL